MREADFEVGQKVLVYYPARFLNKTDKFLHKWTGPFLIKKISDDGRAFDIEGSKDGQKILIDKVDVSRLKPYHEREDLISEIEMRESQSLPYINGNPIAISESFDSEDSLLPMIGTQDDQDSQETEIYDYTEQLPEKSIAINLDSETESESTPANVQVTNPVPQLRRSQRTRNKPNWYRSSNILVMLILFYFFASVGCTFNKVSPVIWRKSEQPLITGINRVIANIQFESPCRVFDDGYYNWSNVTLLKDWCIELFERQAIDRLKEFCSEQVDNSDISLNFKDNYQHELGYQQDNQDIQPRKKWVALLALGLRTIISVVITSIIGLSATALSEIVKVRNDYNQMKKINQDLLDKLQIFSKMTIDSKIS